MSEFDYMSPSEQLVALLDGELHASEATPLFLELTHNPELQDEMHELLTLKQFFGVPHSAPPDHLKKNILLSTGLGTATAVISSGAASSPISRFWMGLVGSRGMMMLLSAILGSLATILFVNLGNGGGGSFQKAPLNSSFNAINAVAKVDDLTNNQKVIVTAQQSRTPLISSFIEKEDIPVVDDDISLNHSSNDGNNDINSSYNSPTVPVILLADLTDSSFPRKIHVLPLNELSKINLLQQIDEDESYYDHSNMFLQLRGFTARSIPEFNLSPLDAPVLNNIGIGLFYRLDRHISVGLEVGQESLLQKYEGIDKEGIPTQWQQNYMAFWTGIAGQYNFNHLTNIPELQPFTRIFIGGTKVGPMLRAILGLKYNYQNTLDIFSGVETTALFYRFQGNTFTTQKIGLTFGGSVHF